MTTSRLPQATGLISYPSNCFSFSGRRPFYDLPRIESYCAPVVIARPGQLPLGALNSRSGRFFSHSGCDTTTIQQLCFVQTVKRLNSTLAHSSNFRSLTDCVHLIVSNRNSKASLGFAAGSYPLFAFQPSEGDRSPPDSIFVYLRKGTTLFVGAGDMCLSLSSAAALRFDANKPTCPQSTQRSIR